METLVHKDLANLFAINLEKFALKSLPLYSALMAKEFGDAVGAPNYPICALPESILQHFIGVKTVGV
jgi:hypothetical protein